MLLVVSTLARLALAGVLDLGQDESYALAISRNFQWSFFDHPPLAFWIAGLMQALFGPHLPPLLLRLPFVLMFTGSTWAMFALARRFYGERAGLWAAGLFTTAPFFFASAGSWVVPDGPLTLFLLLAANFLAGALAAEDRAWRNWLLAGLFLGLALLSKYQAATVGVGAFAALLLPGHRKWLRRPQPYVAALLALLLFTPVIWWNAANGWVSFAFQLGRGGSGSSAFDLSQTLLLFGGEAAYLLPWTLLGLIVAVIAARRDGGGRFLLALALPTLLLFNLLPFIGAAGLPHWSMPGWMFLFPLLGRTLASAAENRARWPFVFGALSVASTAAIAVGAVALISDARVYSGNPALNHYLEEATSWTGIRDGLAKKHLLQRPHTFFAAISWLDAAHLAEAVRPAQPPVVLGGDPRGFAFLQNPNAHLGEDAIFVADNQYIALAKALAAAHFESVEEVGSFETKKGGSPAFAQTVLLARHFNRPVNPPYGLK